MDKPDTTNVSLSLPANSQQRANRRWLLPFLIGTLVVLGGYLWWKSKPINSALWPSHFVQLMGYGQGLEFLPDGKTLMVSGGGKIQFLDADTGRVMRSWQTEADSFLRLSKDGRSVLTSHYDRAKNQFTPVLYDVESGRVLWKKSWQGYVSVEGHTANLTKLFISHDQTQLLVETAIGTVRTVPFKGHVSSARFSADGKYICLPGFRNASQILRSDTLRPAFPQLQLPPLRTLRLKKDNQSAIGVDKKGTLHFWNLKTNAHNAVQTGLEDSRWFYWLNDGTLVITGTRKQAKNYNTSITQFRSADGAKILRDVPGHIESWSDNGKWLLFRLSNGRGAYSRDEEIYQLYEAQTGKISAYINNLTDVLGQPAPSVSIFDSRFAISPDARRLASLNQAGLLRFFDLDAKAKPTGSVSTSKGRTVLSFNQEIKSVAVAPDGLIAASGIDNSQKGDYPVKIFRNGHAQTFQVDRSMGQIASVDFSPDSQTLMGLSSWGLWSVDLPTARISHTVSQNGSWGRHKVGKFIWPALSAREKRLFVFATQSFGDGEGSLTEWDKDLTYQGERTIIPSKEKRDGLLHQMAAANPSPDGRKVIVMWQAVIRSGASTTTKSKPALQIIPKGFAEIRDAATGKTSKLLQMELTSGGSALRGGALRTPVWSPDGTLIAAADQGGRVFIWKADSGKLVGQLSGTRANYAGGMTGAFVDIYFNQAATLAFSPDNRFLAAARDDNSLYLYDLKTLLPIAQIGLSPAPATVPRYSIVHGPRWIEFSPDGRTLYGVPVNGKEVRAWDVPQIP